MVNAKVTELDRYMENILITTVGSVMPRNQGVVSMKQRPINLIKEDVYNFLDVEDTVKAFTDSYTSKMKEHMSFFKLISDPEKRIVNKCLASLKFATKEVNMKQLINSNLEGLACYLARLKVIQLTKDAVAAKKILEKFVKQNDLNLGYVAEEIADFSLKLEELEKSYLKFIDTINSISTGLENKMMLNHSGVLMIQDMKNLAVKQKEMLWNIETTFFETCKELKKAKTCAMVLKGLGL